MPAKTDSAVTWTDKCCNIIRNLNLVHIIRTHADHYHYAEMICISWETLRLQKCQKVPVLLQCGPITNFSLMIGPTIFVNGGRQIHTSHRGSFLRNFNLFCYFIGLLTVIWFWLQPKEGKHCQPSSTSFGLVDRFKGNYSATGRAKCSSGRGKSITP